jgi:nicotinamide phosphoribosyltransferase
MYRNRPLTAIDFYKADHRRQYPKGTEFVYSNFTPRSDRLFDYWEDKTGEIVFFGLQGFIKAFLIDTWNKEFFKKPKWDVVNYYKRRMDNSLGVDSISIQHIEDLHDLGFLPIKIKALPEGSTVSPGVPVLTIINTIPKFFWLTNYLESVLSSMLWKPCTSATIAREYKILLSKYAEITGAPKDFIQFQAHDFSFRGLSGLEDSMMTGAGHLTSFWGTDSVPAIDYLEDYYNADCTKETIGVSVPATEHSVMCAGGKIDELETYKRLITELYPAGIVSIVSDTWDIWKVITEYTKSLKSEILNREGKVVLRPDSGNPADIICGNDKGKCKAEIKGALVTLWEQFGGTETDKGYKILNEKIGLIYGDSITLTRAKEILSRMEKLGFASCNIVLGVGSYTYQYVTRDTFGFAMKATWAQVNGIGRSLFKDPITDSGVKKSACGLLKVDGDTLIANVSEQQELEGDLKEVFKNGRLLIETSLNDIRNNLTNKKNN